MSYVLELHPALLSSLFWIMLRDDSWWGLGPHMVDEDQTSFTKWTTCCSITRSLALFKKSLRKLVYHKNLVSISFWNSVDTWEECWELSNGPNTQVPLFTPNNRPLGIMTIRSFTVTHDEELEPNLYIALKHHMVKMTDIMIAGKMFYWPSNRPFVTPTLHRHKFQ